MSKHRRTPLSASDPKPRRRPLLTWIAAGAAGVLGVTVVTATVTHGDSTKRACKQATRRLTVAVAPALYPLVHDAARKLQTTDQRAGCVRLVVSSADPAVVAGSLATSPVDAPDVWVPDSSMWRPAGVGAGTSVARSAAVLAVPWATAETLGFPAHRPTADQLLGSTEGRAARLALADPARSAPAVSAVLGLQAAAHSRRDGRVVFSAALTAARRHADGALPEATTGTAEAVATTEQAVWTHDRTYPQSRAVAVYPAGATGLDYPWLVLAPNAAARSDAAFLLRSLQSPAFRGALTAHGFRPATGAAPAWDGATGVDASAAPGRAAATGTDARTTARLLSTLALPSRMLTVIDVSGSMGLPVPQSPSTTRLALALQAVGNGMSMLGDETDAGLWVFSTHLTPTTDYRQLVPLGPLGVRADGATGRQALARALSTVRPVPDGSTGLYDTALAAVRAARTGWLPDRVTSVVLLTDGRNEDDHGLSESRLLATLARENDPQRPVPVIGIAYGPDSDVAALRAISKVTGGATYRVLDPRDARAVLQDALSRRTCRPSCSTT